MDFKTTRRGVLKGLTAGGALAALTAPMQALAQTESLRIGTSSTGSVFYTLGVGMGEIIRDQAGINTTVEPVGGSAANVNGIARDNIDIAISNAFSAYSGYNGLNGFDDKVDLRLMLQGQASLRWVFVRTGSGIQTPKDLEGKTIIGERRSLPELAQMFDVLLAQFDVDKSKVNIVSTTNSSESIDAIRSGTVDAIIMPFSPRASNIEKAMADDAMLPLMITAEERDSLLKDLPEAFFGVDQKANDFSNQPDVVPLVALRSYLITGRELDADLVYRAGKALFENTEKFASFHATGKRWTLENTLKNPAIPFHEGVIRYFEEQGVWTDELAQTQERLLAN